MMSKDLYTLNSLVYRFVEKSEDEDTHENNGGFQLGPLSLGIPKNKLTCILGRSGSGKTTLLTILGLLRKADSGEVNLHLNGTVNDTIPIHEKWGNNRFLEDIRARHLGFALQKGELLPYLSLQENASLLLEYNQISDESIAARIGKVFKQLYQSEYKKGKRFKKLLDSKPQNVSQGQYQRGAMARALANEPQVVLADEPTGNLDVNTAVDVIQILSDYIQQKSTEGRETSVIVVTHDVHLAVQFADHIVILKEGRLIEQMDRGDAGIWKTKEEEEKDQPIEYITTLLD